MKLNRLSSALLIALFATSGFNLVRADEGMWTFNNVPRAEIKKKYGFEVTDAWLKKVQLATVRFNSGGTGSFVSADGLVLTNHHIASDVLQKISILYYLQSLCPVPAPMDDNAPTLVRLLAPQPGAEAQGPGVQPGAECIDEHRRRDLARQCGR